MKIVLMFNEKKDMYDAMRFKFTDNMKNVEGVLESKKYKEILGIPETGRICIGFANINRENDKEFANKYAKMFKDSELYCVVLEYNDIEDYSDNFIFSKHNPNVIWSEDVNLDNAIIMTSFAINNNSKRL